MDHPVLPSGRSPALGAAVEAGGGPASTEAAERHAGADVETVAQALRGACAHTGMSAQQVVAKLAEGGFEISVARLRGWERTGVIRVDAASRLADAYGITIDTLAGRRAFRSYNQRP